MRSTFTNQLIKSMLDNGGNYLRIDCGYDIQTCHSFREACEVLDHAQEALIWVVRKMDAYKYGWLHLDMTNEGADQCCDFTTPGETRSDFIQRRVNRLTDKYAA